MEVNEKPKFVGRSIVFRDSNYIFIYNTVNKLVAKINSAGGLDDGCVIGLREKGFFSDISIDTISNRRVSNLMLLLSRGCRLRCRYCSVDAGKDNALMNTDIADRSIRIYLATNPLRPRVTLFAGGEPTLNVVVIKNIIEKYGDRISWITTTSGVLPESFLEWLITRNVNISFSLDGPPYIQDYLRPLKDGRPSSSIVENSIKIWRERTNKPLTIRTTITDETVHKIDEILDYFDNLEVQVVHIESLYNLGRAVDHGQSLLRQPSIQDFIQSIVKVLKWGKEKNKRVKVGCLSYFFNPSLSSYCGPLSGSTVVVNHKGLLTACSEVVDERHGNWKSFCIGQLGQNSFEIDKEKMDYLSRLNPSNMSSCSNCFARYICRGGCAHKNLSETDSLEIPSSRHCDFIKRITPVLIKRIALGQY